MIEVASKIMDYRGRTPKKLGMEWGGGSIPAISARNVRMGSIDFGQEFYLGSEALYRRWMTQGDMKKGDILITTEAPLGNVAAIPDNRRYILSQRTVLIRPDPTAFDPTYVLKVLQSPLFQNLLTENATGSTALGIRRRRLEQLPILVPPIEEQSRIGEALQDNDDLVATLERMIAKKEAIKQGMMQQLLSGRTRLPGFTEPWSMRSIEDLAVVDPESLGTGTSRATEIDYISLEDVSKGSLLGSTRLKFGNAPSRARRIVKSGDVLFGTVRPNLQSHMYYRGGLRFPVASTGFTVVRPTAGNEPSLIFYLLMSDIATAQVDRIIAGSSYPAVSSRDVRALIFDVPGPEEQKAVARALDDADSEIVALRRRVRKALDVKQGMMQELLSGRTRFHTSEVAR